MIKSVFSAIMASSMILGISVQAQETVVVGAGGNGSMSMTYMAEIAAESRRIAPYLRVYVKETGGSFDNYRRLAAGEIEAAMVALPAIKAETPDNAAVLWMHDAFPLLLVVREDAKIDDLKSIDGRRIIPGAAGSMLERTAPELFEHLGVKPNWRRAAWAQFSYLLRSDQVDGFIASKRVFDSIQAEYGVPPLKVIEMTPDQVAKLESFDEDITVSTVMVDGRPVMGWGFRAAVIARKTIPDHVAETLTKAAVAVSRSGRYPDGVDTFLADGTADRIRIPVHPASVKVLSRER